MKVITSKNKWLSQFVADHDSQIEINRILNAVNRIIDNNDNSAKWYPTKSLQIAVVTSAMTKIYEDMESYEDNNSIEPSFTLPTADFKVILETWRAYLLA